MKGRMKIKVLFVAMAFLWLLLSCENPIQNKVDETVEAFISLESKDLVSSIDTTIAEYRYTATPLFTLASGYDIYGIKTTEYSIGSNGAASLGYFTQGRWRFHVYAYNKDKKLVREGESVVYLYKLASGVKNTISVTLYQTVARTGNIHMNIRTNKVNDNIAAHNMMVSYTHRQSGAKVTNLKYNVTEQQATEQLIFDIIIYNLKSGNYDFTVYYYNGTTKLGGETFSTYILGDGATTQVSGTLYPGQWISGGFELVIPPPVNGRIAKAIKNSDGTESYLETAPFALKLNQLTVFKWLVNRGSNTPKKYQWYLNGVENTTFKESLFPFEPKDYGVYTISCVTTDDTGMEMGYHTVQVMVADGVQRTFRAILSASSNVSTQTTSDISPMSLIQATWSLNSRTIFSGYLELPPSQVTGNLRTTITAEGRTITITFTGGKITATGLNSGDSLTLQGVVQ